MKPSKEYLDSIAKKLGALNALDNGGTNRVNNIERYETKMPSLIDQMGITAQKYLEDKKRNEGN